jgi:drug/metabolite transporter (DMT)-like permease
MPQGAASERRARLRRRVRSGNNTAAAPLVIVGVVLVFLGLFGGNLPIIITGVVALIAAGALQVLSARRSCPHS